MKKIAILLNIFLLIVFSQLSAQEIIKPGKLNVKWDLDPLGNAHIEASSSLDAMGWDNYKRTFGSNPDILKRQMERAFPGFFLQNFSYKEDVMNRGWALSFDALGMSKINSKGLWEIDLNSKNPDVTKISDHNYVLTSNYNSQGSLMQEIDKINFPAAAADIKQDKDAFGKAIFIYTSSTSGGTGNWLILGLGIILALVGLSMLMRSKPVAMAAVRK
jgi:hypothetical protein